MALMIEIEGIPELSGVEAELANTFDYGIGSIGTEWKKPVIDALETAREGLVK